MRMPFGKHKGEEIEDIPESYLEWLWDNVDLSPRLESEVRWILFDKPKWTSKRGSAPPPPPPPPKPPPDLPAPDIKLITPCYRRMAKKYHPDAGGSTKEMQAINEFYDAIRKAIESL